MDECTGCRDREIMPVHCIKCGSVVCTDCANWQELGYEGEPICGNCLNPSH
jgi:DNA-directed RNA polymerase subunit N (RpoN/RPB10)